MKLWIATLVVGIASITLRSVPVLLFARAELPRRTEQMLRHAATAALSAIVAAMLVNYEAHTGAREGAFAVVALAVTVAAVTVARRSYAVAAAAGLATYAVLALAVAPIG